MDEEKNKIDDIFRKGLNDYKAEPSDKVWKNIERIRNYELGIRNKISKFKIYAYVAAGLVFVAAIVVLSFKFQVPGFMYQGSGSKIATDSQIQNSKSQGSSSKIATDSQIQNSKSQGSSSKIATDSQIQSSKSQGSRFKSKGTEQLTTNNKKRDISIKTQKQLTKNNEQLTIKNEQKTINNQPNFTQRPKDAKTINSDKKDTSIKTQVSRQSTKNNEQGTVKNENTQQTTVNGQQTTVNNDKSQKSTDNSQQTSVDSKQPIVNIEKTDTTKKIQESNQLVINNSTSSLTKEQQQTKVNSEQPTVNNEKADTSIKAQVSRQITISEDTSKNKLVTGELAKQNKPDILIGGNYTPEYFTSKSQLLTNKNDFTNSTDLSLTFLFHGVQIRTGVGLSFHNTDNWNYTINYNKSEQVGKYDKVDSVTFTVVDNKVKPTYYTSERIILGTVNEQYNSSILINYTYLQIPLVVGYTVDVYKRFSFSINAGIIYSDLISTKGGSIIYPDNVSQNQITTIENNEIQRNNSYWNYLVNIGINYYINRRISLNFEPTYKSILGTIYNSGNLQEQKPYTFGIRTGIYFKF